MPLTCSPIDILCQIASFFEVIWILITLTWVGSAGLISFMIFNKIRLLISKKITVEFAIIPTLLIMYWVYTIVAFLTIASVGIVIALALGGFITLPMIIGLFSMFKEKVLGLK